MIYTITFNPAVDLVMQVDDIKLGDLNRSHEDHYVAGGKGINASVVFQRLGKENIATGFIGGFSGQFIIDELEAEGVNTHFIELDQPTRINVKLKGPQETEINAQGPKVDADKFQELMTYLNKELTENDTVFLAGNAAPGLDEEAYISIAKLCLEKKVNFVLDSNKQLLKACLEYKPFIIKPNREELGELFATQIESDADLIKYAKALQEAGALNVLVSLGGDGSLLLTERGDIYRANVPTGKVINSVGAGDSMLSGFISAYVESKDYAESLKIAAATGSGTAFSVGITTKDLVEELVDQIVVKKEN
ncbi:MULTISPECIES: 1-phosphofructokinase [Aerococcus]|uniref:1-phosphofructokinase n=1 Tax=Aerococcus TaxID=1375 RepID=UPI000DCD2CBA|nr:MULTISPECIES: 1-phosphofructokinase [Aerococcus]MDK7302374.1 1-phosphofructokinase [Aerococcus urinae]RAV70105.1 1-phosphofructokinase [Aerococcus urinae]RAW04315.1 1-phosphofructokinase [Aerococcus urinae]WMF95252.1 1-phosphofructokinase [Aerococcus mictus]